MGELEDLLDLNKKKVICFFTTHALNLFLNIILIDFSTTNLKLKKNKKKFSLSLGFESRNIYNPIEKDLNMKWNIYTIPDKKIILIT